MVYFPFYNSKLIATFKNFKIIITYIMGYKVNVDGKCKICDIDTYIFCDSCGQYVCEDHRKEVHIGNTVTARVYCKLCRDKNRKQKIATDVVDTRLGKNN